MPIYEYGEVEIAYLKSKDQKLAEAIDRIGKIERNVIHDPFVALISSIVAQQVSIKAAETVYARLTELVSVITPESIGNLSEDDIQKCGMTFRKAGYIKGIAEAVLTGEVDFHALHQLTDEEVIKKLSALSGIGIWTVEMLLIHSLCRPDVVSYGDLAIRRGMMNLYGLDTLSKSDFESYRKRYTPHGTVASLYLWALSVEEPEGIDKNHK
ncbi:MAG: DNA-3-methyladenine glycosylase [Clostridiales bacterium]|nr:DNA-3-methyladenine glycosylase [Clostridiales bacterium]